VPEVPVVELMVAKAHQVRILCLALSHQLAVAAAQAVMVLAQLAVPAVAAAKMVEPVEPEILLPHLRHKAQPAVREFLLRAAAVAAAAEQAERQVAVEQQLLAVPVVMAQLHQLADHQLLMPAAAAAVRLMPHQVMRDQLAVPAVVVWVAEASMEQAARQTEVAAVVAAVVAVKTRKQPHLEMVDQELFI
jgi:hypothetical protein